MFLFFLIVKLVNLSAISHENKTVVPEETIDVPIIARTNLSLDCRNEVWVRLLDDAIKASSCAVVIRVG